MRGARAGGGGTSTVVGRILAETDERRWAFVIIIFVGLRLVHHILLFHPMNLVSGGTNIGILFPFAKLVVPLRNPRRPARDSSLPLARASSGRLPLGGADDLINWPINLKNSNLCVWVCECVRACVRAKSAHTSVTSSAARSALGAGVGMAVLLLQVTHSGNSNFPLL